MAKLNPNFSKLSKIEEDSLVARLDAIRQTISHAGEKGRALESEVGILIKSFLPNEYGVSTGFIAYHTSAGVGLSTQLDLIIYDALRGGPIARLGSCDVFPLEAAYAYVEVKASLCSTSDDAQEYGDNSIEMCILKNKMLRSMNRRHYYKVTGVTTAGLVEKEWMPIRSYVFAFESAGNIAQNPELFAERMHTFLKRTEAAHMHGVFVGGSSFYSTKGVDPRKAHPKDFYHVEYTSDHLLSTFKWSLLHGLSRFPRCPQDWTPALDKYDEAIITWKKFPPDLVANDSASSLNTKGD